MLTTSSALDPTQQSTSANEVHSSADKFLINGTTIANGTGGVSQATFFDGDWMKVETVTVGLNVHTAYLADLHIWMTSPSGTTVDLLRPGTGAEPITDKGVHTGVWASLDTGWNFTTTAFAGETGYGSWNIYVQDVNNNGFAAGTFSDAKLDLFGSKLDVNNTYFYTDEFGTLTGVADDASRSVLRDTNGGIDTINASAVTSGIMVDLYSGSAYIAGCWLTVGGIENIIAGDGNDNLRGDGLNNEIRGMRGDDTIDGGEGIDTAYYAGRRAEFVVSGSHRNFTVTDGVAGREGTDTVYNVEYLHFDDGTYSIGDLLGNQAPQVVTADYEVRRYGDLALSSLISTSDADGDPIVSYRFYDATADAASGYFTINGVPQAANQIFGVNAAQFAQTRVQAGTTADDLWVQVSDGMAWSTWKEFHLTPPVNHAPVVTTSDQSVAKNASLVAASLFSVSDADGDAMTAYAFWDSTADATSGHFVVNGVVQPAGQIIMVNAAQLAQTTFQTGATADDLWVQAYDGAAWSGWKEYCRIGPAEDQLDSCPTPFYSWPCRYVRVPCWRASSRRACPRLPSKPPAPDGFRGDRPEERGTDDF